MYANMYSLQNRLFSPPLMVQSWYKHSTKLCTNAKGLRSVKRSVKISGEILVGKQCENYSGHIFFFLYSIFLPMSHTSKYSSFKTTPDSQNIASSAIQSFSLKVGKTEKKWTESHFRMVGFPWDFL